MLLALMLPFASQAQETLTVYDGTNTNSYVPFNGLYADYGTRSQFIMPATDLAEMEGATISGLTFYGASNYSFDEGITVYMKEVENTTFASATMEDWSSMTAVYTGTISISNNQWMITLSTPYSYSGGNLMIGIQVTTWGSSCPTTSWYGVNQGSSYTAVYNNANSSHTWSTDFTRETFLPKTTFTYEPSGDISCYPVKGLAVDESQTTTESITLTWIDTNNTDATYIVYTIAGTDTTEVDAANINITGTTAVITGLNANTPYTFGVKVDCGNGDVTAMRTVNGHTACGVITIDDENSYSEDFNSYTTDISTSTTAPSSYPNHTMPNCWSFLNMSSSSSDYPMAFMTSSTSYAASGNCLFFKSSSSTPIYAILPVFANESSTRIRFSYRNEGVTSDNGTLSVGYITDATDASTFTAVATFPRITTITSAEALFTSSMLADGARIAFRYTGGSSNNYYLSIDNVVVEQGPSCFPAINLTADSVTSESVTLNWSGDAGNYAVIDVVNEESFETEDNTYTITDLEPNTLYTFGVVSLCSDGNSDTVFTTVRTQCVAIDLPLVESFENSSETTPCWTFAGNSVYNNGNMGITTASGHKVMKFLADSYDGSVNSNYLQYGYSPVLNVSDEATALNVKVRYSTYYSSYGTYVQLYFGYKLADGTEIWDENGHRTSGTSTYAYYTDTIPATAVQVMVKYRATSYGSNYTAYIDSVMIEEIEDELCFPVTNIAVDSNSTSTISLSWVSDAENFTILNMADSSVVATCNETNYTVEELEANTSYNFGVVVNCASSNSDTMIIECRTACAPMVIDSENSYSEDFNSYTTDISTSTTAPSNYPNHTMPYCWSFLNMSSSSSSYPMAFLSTNSGYPVSGNCLFFRSSNTTPLYAILPYFSTEGIIRLRFSYRNEGVSSYNGTLSVGYITDATDASTFTAIETFPQTTTITSAEALFTSSMLADGARIAFRYTGGSNDNYYLSIDNVVVEQGPSCMKVINPTAESVTSESVTLSWTSDAENFIVYNMADSSVVANVTEPAAMITGLNSNTAYTFGVVVDCGDGDISDTVCINVRTACSTISQLPWTDNCDEVPSGDYQMPYCWSRYANANHYPYSYANNAHSGLRALYWYIGPNTSYSTYADTAIAILPQVDIEALTISELQLSFYGRMGDASANILVYVGTMSDPEDASTFQMEDTVRVSGNTYNRFDINLTNAPTTNSYVAIMALRPTTLVSLYIDDVILHEQPTCAYVTNTAAIDSLATEESVTISWEDLNNTGATYTIYNMADGSVVETGIDNTVYTIAGLSANTIYTFGIAANCGDSDAETITVSARTACGVITIDDENSYSEDFNSYTTDIATSTTAPSSYPNHTMPSCWDFLNMSSSSSDYPMAFLSTNSGYPVSGNCLFFKSSSSTPIYAILPVFANESSTHIRFSYRNEGVSSSNGTLSVGYITDATDASTFTAVATFPRISTITSAEALFSSSMLADGARIAFRYTGGSYDNYYLSIDNVVVEQGPSCFPVANLAVDSNSTSTISLSWVSDAENFTILNMADSSVVATCNETNYTVEELDANTTYNFGVVVNCADGNSDTVTISANTACADVTVFPFIESFEGTDLGCWTSEGQSTWTVGAGNNPSAVTTAYFGNKNAKIGHNETGDVTKLISPVLTTEEEVSALKVTFAHVQSRWSNDVDVHRVLYRTSEEGAWNEAVSYTEEITSWTVDSVMLPGNTYQIAFEFIDGYGYGVGIDSVVISTSDGNFCWPATSLTVDDEATTANSVTITWEGTAANYSIYNGQTVVATTTDNTYTLTNLAAASTYVIGVRALCSEEDSSDLVTVIANTPCGAINVFPYEQTFDAEPNCWTKIDADGDGYNWSVLSGYTAIQSASWVSPATPLTPDNWLITPQISLPATGSYEVTWTAMAQDQDWPMEHYGIFISTTGNTDTSDFTMIQEWTLSSGAFNPIIDLSAYAGQDIYLALRHFNCTDMFRISIDDFIIREQPGANQVTINLQQNNPAYGSVTGAGVYNIGDSVTVSATPASSYVFNRWVDENNVTVSSDNPYTFVAATDLTLKAIFLSSSADTYTITVEVNDSTMGTATGGGVYADGDAAVLIATAFPGYRFVNWTHTTSDFGVTEFSTDDTTVVTVTGNKTYTANFEASAVVDTFTVTLNTTAGGTVSPMGSTRVADGTLFTATATADSGYHFVNWTNANGAAVSTNNPYAFTVNANVTLTAHFQANDPQVTYYNVIITSADTTMGTATATATGQVAENTSVTATAVALTGYRFVNWTDANGTVVNATNPYTFTVTSDVTLVANFVANGPTPVEATIDASEITYWVGEGSNQAVVAINWADAAYAWGVKFSAASITVQDALDIIKGTDRRFDYTLGDYGLENITFDENDIHLSGSSPWNQKLNNEYGDGLAQNVVNGDFVKWGEENAGTVVDSTYYENWGWYYTYVFEMTILPIWAYVGIQSVDMSNVSIYSANSTIYVKGTEGQIINIYDLNGRTIVTKLNATETMEIPMEETGVYLVRIGNAPAKRVIVMR